MNKFWKLLLCGVLVLNINVAFADDADVDDDDDEVIEQTDNSEASGGGAAAKAVAQRMDCKTMKAKVDELAASGENATELDSLRKKYRKDCVTRANGRARNARSAYMASVVVANAENAANAASQESDAGTQARAARRGNTAPKAGGGKQKAMASMASASIAKAAPAPVADAKDSAADKDKSESNGGTISYEQIKMCDKLLDKMATFDEDTKATMKETYDSYCAKPVVAPENVVKMTLLALGGIGGDKTASADNADVADSANATAVAEPAAPAGPTEEEIMAQQIANLEAGLCADGTKPNKYGCCTGEKFKDMGNLEFACCPDDGGECFPPMF